MYLSRLDNEVIFKKAFTDKLVFTQFVKDVIGIDIIVNKIETEKRFKPKVAYIDFAYDIFAESTDDRVIVEIQRVNYDYNFDRFLHYHTMAITQLQRKASDYKIKPTVYTIVILTTPSVIEDKDGETVQDDVLISDVNPRNRKGQVRNFYGHQLIFLTPKFKTDETPTLRARERRVVPGSWGLFASAKRFAPASVMGGAISELARKRGHRTSWAHLIGGVAGLGAKSAWMPILQPAAPRHSLIFTGLV